MAKKKKKTGLVIVNDNGEEQEVYLQQTSLKERQTGITDIIEQYIKMQEKTENVNGNVDVTNRDTSSTSVMSNFVNSHYNPAHSIEDIGDNFSVRLFI